MPVVPRACLVALVAVASGCVLNPDMDSSPPDPARPEAPKQTYIWTAKSEYIEVAWFSFFAGGARYGRSREELALESQERHYVASMQMIEPEGDCYADSREATITVYEEGTEKHYFASEYGGLCGRDATLVGYEPAFRLLGVAGCLSAKSYDGSTRGTAASIRPDDGCYHGLFNATATTREWWFSLSVATAGPLRVFLDDCNDRELELEATGDTTLATATNTPGTDCPEITFDAPGPGAYSVHVAMLGGESAGDFFLRVDSIP